MAHRGNRQKIGCLELIVVAFILFIVVQVGAVALEVLAGIASVSITMLRWAGLGIAGAVGALLAGGLIYFVLGGLAKGLGKLFGWKRTRREVRRELASYRAQARQWRRGIFKTVRRLRRRGWLSRADAVRYLRVTGRAVARLRCIEGDLVTLRSLPATEKWTASVDKAARTIVQRLERTHMALVKLLAESALQPNEGVALDLRESADELESLLAAIEEVKGSGPMPTSTLISERLPTTEDTSSTSRQKEPSVDELLT